MKLSSRMKLRIAWGAVILVGLGALVWVWRDRLWDREAILAFGEGIPAPLFLVAFLVLPLVGFPVSLLLALAGIRFGFAGGMALAAGGMFFHNAAAYWMTHSWFRERLRRRLERLDYRIPAIDPKNQAWFTALFAGIHGPPYAAKLYLLALTDVSFRIYLWVGTPIYVIFSVVPVGVGSAATNFNPALAYWLAAISAVLIAGGFGLKRMVRKSP